MERIPRSFLALLGFGLLRLSHFTPLSLSLSSFQEWSSENQLHDDDLAFRDIFDFLLNFYNRLVFLSGNC
ncbi:hypothetical protein SDJN02_04681, partial [Cucurbita argyrosperma subsp. argyrosperma]